MHLAHHIVMQQMLHKVDNVFVTELIDERLPLVKIKKTI
jgi:hypothetical protein